MKNYNDIAAIRITDKEKSANDIMGIYWNNALENTGVTWYSTDVSIKQEPTKVIFFHNTQNSKFYYMADILEIRSFENEEIITEKEIPEVYKDVPKKTWIRISNIKKMDEADLKKYYAVKDNELLFDKVNKKIFNLAYFYQK
ncbi:MAG: hypothetical protein E6584_21680 [Enterobacter hormaechei]|nr:hypothetical protein [Enterobacter hormaechei]